MNTKVLFLFLCEILWSVESAKILAMFPMPSISHQVIFRELTQELANRGHHLTIITTDPVYPKGLAPDNYREIDIHDVSYKTLRQLFHSKYQVDHDILTLSELKESFSMIAYIFEAQVLSPEFKDFVSNETNNFDLIILEAMTRPALGLSHIFKAPVILVSSLGAYSYNYDAVGVSTHPFLYPSLNSRRICNVTISEKVEELYYYFREKYVFDSGEDLENKILQRVLDQKIPPLSELSQNVDMMFLNVHSIWADNQPVPPNVIYIGGIYEQKQKQLPNDLKQYLNSSKNGVIYLSFGTNVFPEMIPRDKIDVFTKVLSNLSYDVLWKWNHDELPGKGDNIQLSKWFPQNDVLNHPNIKLFITHAGLQSTHEAIKAKVPLLGIPMFGDQWYNAEKYVKHGIGINLDIKTLDEITFKRAIETVIETPSYRQNIIKLNEYLSDNPDKPLDRAVWWTEYVIRHKGAKHLKSAAANMSNAEYFEIRLLLTSLLALAALTVLAIIVLKNGLSFISKVFFVREKLKLM